MWEEAFKIFGIYTFAISAFSFVALALGKHYINKVGFEAQTKFSLLHEKRAEIIAKLYVKIMVMERAMGRHLDFQSPDQEQELEEAAEKAGQAFTDYQDNELLRGQVAFFMT